MIFIYSQKDMNLKQVVEALAMQHNLTFLPARRRHENGSQISLPFHA
jgi:hypothetical protein